MAHAPGPRMSEYVVAIAMPCGDMVHAGTALDLVSLVGHTVANFSDIRVHTSQVRGTILPEQRATLVRQAKAVNATHILFVDSDMRFPKDGLVRLLAHGKPIVATNYPTRRPPIIPTAEHRDKGFLFTQASATGLADVTRCGMGFMLVDMAVFETIPEPWFAIGYNTADGRYTGEDTFFLNRARKVGQYETLIDQDLSKHVKHIGAIEFENAHTLLTRDAAPQEPQVERRLELVNAHGDAHGPER